MMWKELVMKNAHSVYSAWNGDKLVGLINYLSDGIMTAYFHYSKWVKESPCLLLI